MRIGVFYRGGSADLGLKRYVGLRLMSYLDQLERGVDGVTALLDDTDAARGPEAHRCRIVARLASGAQVAVEHAGADLYASIDAAAERLAELVRLAATTAGRAGVVRFVTPTRYERLA